MKRFDDKLKLFKVKGLAARASHLALKKAFADGLRRNDPKAYDIILDQHYSTTIAASPDEIAVTQDQTSIDTAIAFLAADAYYFRSGYLKQVILRKLKRLSFDKEQKKHLASLVVKRILQPNQYQFSDYVRLAPFLGSEELEKQISNYATSSDPGIRQRAQIMLDNINQHHKDQKRNQK